MPCPGRILIIDHDEATREALAGFVRTMGCQAVTARDGLAGLAELGRGPPACLVLVDLGVPRITGEELVVRLRRSAPGSELPIVSLSSGGRELAPPAVERHLSKPFSVDEIWPTIERCCRATIRVEPSELLAQLS